MYWGDEDDKGGMVRAGTSLKAQARARFGKAYTGDIVRKSYASNGVHETGQGRLLSQTKSLPLPASTQTQQTEAEKEEEWGRKSASVVDGTNSYNLSQILAK